MTTQVPRHALARADDDLGLEALAEDADESIDDLEESPRMFNSALSANLTLAKARCQLDSTAELLPTWEAWVAAMQVGSAMFAAATATEETVQCRIADKVRTIPATGPQYYTDANKWITAFWLAIICREQDRMTTLANVPISALRESGAVFDEYVYAWIETLQTWWLRGGDLSTSLKAAIDGTAPEELHNADREEVLQVLYPPINLFFRFLLGDHQQFNTELLKTLQWHKGYWTKNEDRASSSAGLVALGPLAIACLAHDAGFPIEVESDYLPECLLNHSWRGEIDT
ncbi:immunity 49 family protein [Streptomyces sp. NPDC059002]|uniref:immunity 49 family protein n=1 Tax=Streptomyces sp. NPDC059002 TaxID=3346690 RepID=UPI00367E0ECC